MPAFSSKVAHVRCAGRSRPVARRSSYSCRARSRNDVCVRSSAILAIFASRSGAVGDLARLPSPMPFFPTHTRP